MSATHFTQWAAQFAVASELRKRRYQVALTLGNHPAADLIVISPEGLPFSVDVKGLSSPNPSLVVGKSRAPDCSTCMRSWRGTNPTASSS
jgi:hypothetical protein